MEFPIHLPALVLSLNPVKFSDPDEEIVLLGMIDDFSAYLVADVVHDVPVPIVPFSPGIAVPTIPPQIVEPALNTANLRAVYLSPAVGPRDARGEFSQTQVGLLCYAMFWIERTTKPLDQRKKPKFDEDKTN